MSASAVTGAPAPAVTGAPAPAVTGAPAPAPAAGGGGAAGGIGLGVGPAAIRNTIINDIRYKDSSGMEHTINKITIDTNNLIGGGVSYGGAANFQQMIQNKLFKRKRNTRRKIVRRKSNKRK